MSVGTKSVQERIDEVLAKALSGAGPVEQVRLFGLLVDDVEDRGIWPPDSLTELRELARWAEALAPRVGSFRIEDGYGTLLVTFPVLFESEAGGEILFHGHGEILATGTAHTGEIILPGRFRLRRPVHEFLRMTDYLLAEGGTFTYDGKLVANS